jgi:hypothetical protein
MMCGQPLTLKHLNRLQAQHAATKGASCCAEERHGFCTAHSHCRASRAWFDTAATILTSTLHRGGEVGVARLQPRCAADIQLVRHCDVSADQLCLPISLQSTPRERMLMEWSMQQFPAQYAVPRVQDGGGDFQRLCQQASQKSVHACATCKIAEHSTVCRAAPGTRGTVSSVGGSLVSLTLNLRDIFKAKQPCSTREQPTLQQQRSKPST